MQVASWSEDGTIKCLVNEQLNNHMRNALPDDYFVFGLDPDEMKFYCWNDEDEKIFNWVGYKPQGKVN